jgi:hypothetical protein
MRITRAQRLQQINDLRARGLTYQQIAAELGIAPRSVRNIVSDPDGAKQRGRKARYQGVCVECGGPTDGSNGLANAPLRCRYCAHGHARPLSEPTRRRRVPVRLSDLPVDVRLEGAREANRRERDPLERAAILLAALHPSDTTYWVAEPRIETAA